MSPIRPENRKRYPKRWRDIRERIMYRADERCECEGECGINHRLLDCEGRCIERHGCNAVAWGTDRGRGNRPATVVLTVAHLDHTPENNHEANLKAMCQRCHNRYDAPERRANRIRRQNEGQEVLEV